jgi:GNAT superfamily N-acetyltransferase
MSPTLSMSVLRQGITIELAMVSIEPLTGSSPPTVLRSAQALLLAYGDFLRGAGDHDGFRYDRLEQEARDLPAAFAAGELLLAISEGLAGGCIAYRALAPCVDENCCEIKRLFVQPEHRARGIGRSLVMAALDHARANGYRFAYLDTEPSIVRVAHHTYLELGFVEYDRRSSATGPVSVLRKPLI